MGGNAQERRVQPFQTPPSLDPFVTCQGIVGASLVLPLRVAEGRTLCPGSQAPALWDGRAAVHTWVLVPAGR